MLSTSLTYIISMIALISYFVYIIARHGTVGFLFSAAIFLIMSAFVDHIEYVTIGLLIVGLTLSIYLQQSEKKHEGFEEEQKQQKQQAEEEVEEATTAAIETPGVASSDETSSSEPATETNSAGDTPPAPSKSAPAPATPQPAMDPTAISKGIQDAMAKLQTTAENAKAVAQPSSASAAASTENFQEPSAGLFKLGELPSEMKKGPFVDVASTMTKAMSSLQPDQIAAMTQESQSLLDTQKNLMNMLQSMRPVLQDGRQLLDTFGSIFGGLGSLGGTNIAGAKVNGSL